ncbi:MAG: 6,7-dimethyl-8-ribityllumazine synthase [Dehalococcoidia bacterium]|jgi:6,7-dimethyl-8-ribityllumazine synthase|nr:6,7-dimethyl-8-ribityllumazine synthase [Dehalococcoidia bacterium]MDP6782428.1 6,7-dimethyl-8-ribityllumazine synthase [Dehalococcoidia bacterium]
MKYQGALLGTRLRFALVVSRFNELISFRLLDGAQDCLVRHGVREADIDVALTPGSFEIPLVAKNLAASGRYQAVVCLGAVIRGDTPHFDFIASEVAKGVALASLETGVPVIFGVVTADNLEQAIERGGVKEGNKGFQAAMSALEMANLMKDLGTVRRRRGHRPRAAKE